MGGWEPISAKKYSRLELTKKRLGETKCSTRLAAHLEKMVVSCQRSRKMSLPFVVWWRAQKRSVSQSRKGGELTVWRVVSSPKAERCRDIFVALSVGSPQRRRVSVVSVSPPRLETCLCVVCFEPKPSGSSKNTQKNRKVWLRFCFEGCWAQRGDEFH